MAREDRVREIEQVVTAHRQLEGGGFVVRRPFPGEIDSVDPFLLIDEMGPVDYAPGKAQVRVIAGEALGAHAVIETRTPIVFQDWTLQPGADVTIPFTPDLRMLVYVFEGSVRIGPNGTTLEEGQPAILGTGDSVRLAGAARPGRILLLGGVPLREPVARYGPFVMNTRAELVQAFEDYESGRMGEITRSAEIQGDANRGGRALDPG